VLVAFQPKNSPTTAYQPKNSPTCYFPAQPNVLFDMYCSLFIYFKKSKANPRIGFFRKLPYPRIRILPIPIHVSVSVLHSASITYLVLSVGSGVSMLS